MAGLFEKGGLLDRGLRSFIDPVVNEFENIVDNLEQDAETIDRINEIRAEQRREIREANQREQIAQAVGGITLKTGLTLAGLFFLIKKVLG